MELCIFSLYFLFRSGRALGEGGGVWVIGLVGLMGWHGEMEVRVCLHMDWWGPVIVYCWPVSIHLVDGHLIIACYPSLGFCKSSVF